MLYFAHINNPVCLPASSSGLKTYKSYDTSEYTITLFKAIIYLVKFGFIKYLIQYFGTSYAVSDHISPAMYL